MKRQWGSRRDTNLKEVTAIGNACDLERANKFAFDGEINRAKVYSALHFRQTNATLKYHLYQLAAMKNYFKKLPRPCYGVLEGALRRKYMLFKKYTLFQKTYILFQKTYILFQKTYVFLNVYICGKTYIFRKAPSRTWCVREGALRKIYVFPQI